MLTTIALVAVASAALVQAQAVGPGAAAVVNYCNYDIPYKNTPGGDSPTRPAEVLGVLKAGNVGPQSTYTQLWYAIGGPGWSVKLDPLNSNYNPAKILQFEYTLTSPTDPQIWFDMSLVNGLVSGLPSFRIDVDGRQSTTNAYKYWNDDAQGMQIPMSRVQSATLVICPESSTAAPNFAGTAAPAAPSAPSAPAPAPAPAPASSSSTVSPPPPSTSSKSSTTLATSASVVNNPGKIVDNTPAVIAASVPSATSSSTTAPPEFDVVTEYATHVVTAFVTETARAHPPHKRHEHRHPHHAHHF